MTHRHSCSHSADVTRRLARIAGQINGVQEMVREGRSCEELLTQLSAVSAAVTQAARVILTEHLEHCVTENFADGDQEALLQDLAQAVEQFARLK